MPRRLEALPCTAVLEQLEAHVDGELAAAEAAAVEAHLEGCPACAAEHALAVDLQRELRALPELDTPRSVLLELSREAERARFRRPARSRRRPAMFRWPSFGAVFRWPPFGVTPARAATALFAAMVIGGGLLWDRGVPAPAEAPPAADPAAVARATEEARYALAYLTRVNRRAGLKLRDDLFVKRIARPSARSLARSLAPHLGKQAAGAEKSDHGDRS